MRSDPLAYAMFFKSIRGRHRDGYSLKPAKELVLKKSTVTEKTFSVVVGLLALGAIKVLTHKPKFGFADKVVVISGGSRGLGLLLGRELAKEGAKLVLLARHQDELDRAELELTELGAEVLAIACDVTNEKQVKKAVEEAATCFGTIDALINNAGIIQVGPMESMTNDDYKTAIDTHFWGPMYLTEAVLPFLRKNQGGRIVNIASVAANVSVPHLLPYCVSKYALRGFSEGITSELRKENIYVTTVCPGLMRTGSHVNALFKGQNKKEYALFSISNALPFFSTTGESAARQIIDASRRGDSELIITLQAQILSKLNGVLPGFTNDVMHVVTKLLPGPDGEGSGTKNATGFESQSEISPSVVTAPADSQVFKNNEAART